MPRTRPRSTAQITGWSVATVPNGQWSLMIRRPTPAPADSADAMWAAKPWAVRASATACIAERSERCPAARASPVRPGGHRPAVRGADLLGHRLRLGAGQAVERPAEQGEHEVVAAHRDAGVEGVGGDGDVALRGPTGAPLAAAGAAADDLDVAAGGELVEVVAGDVRVHADLGGDRRRGDALRSGVVAGEEVDAPAGGVAEGVGDRGDGGGEGDGRVAARRGLVGSAIPVFYLWP